MKLSILSRVSEEEYRANITGMNTFFGAVLGFVLADVSTPNLREFAQLLMYTAAIVIGILYVSASAQRWIYAGFNLLFIWFLPKTLPEQAEALGRLQVTLAIWLFMAVFLEVIAAWQRRSTARAREPGA